MIRSTLLTFFAALFLWGSQAVAGGPTPPEGMIVRPSHHDVSTTLDRLEAALKARGIPVALRWDHAAKARAVGISLRPTQLLLFGNPALGSHFFTAAQTAGIDLPMKALAWEDEGGRVWIGYNDPAWIARRHGITHREAVVAKMRAALASLVEQAAGP